MVLIRSSGNRQTVVGVSRPLAEAGVRPGMTLAQARAVYSGIRPVEHDEHRDASALHAVARWMLRFTPVAGFVPIDEAAVSKSATQVGEGAAVRIRLSKFGRDHEIPIRPSVAGVTGASPVVYLDLTGTEQLHGPPSSVIARIQSSLGRWGVSARIACGPTVGAAWAGTFAPRGVSDEPGNLGALPVAALRLDPATLSALHHLGVNTIADLRKLPRKKLPARFGDILHRRLDQASGLVHESIIPVKPILTFLLRKDFDDPVRDLVVLLHWVEQLAGQLCGQLLRHGLGARELLLELHRPGQPVVTQTVRLSRPGRDPARILHLTRCALETLVTQTQSRINHRKRSRPPPSSAKAPATRRMGEWLLPDEFISVRLRVVHAQPIADEQITLDGSQEFHARRQREELLERLRLRMGLPAVQQVRAVESHIPERTWTCVESHDEAGVTSNSAMSPFPPADHALARPVYLFPVPVEIRVMVSPSHDRDGRPVAITRHDGHCHPVVHCIGPERIGGHWWVGQDKSRDYFDVEIPGGRRWWVFRVNETSRWFFHGEYA